MSSSSYVARFELSSESGLPEALVLNAESDEAIGRTPTLKVTLSMPVGDADSHEPYDAESWVGGAASFAIERVHADGSIETVRSIHGVIASVEEGLEAAGEGRAVYTIELVPRLALLDRVVVQEVFVGASVPTILRDKLTAAGLAEGTDFELRLADESAYLDALPDGRAGDAAKPPVAAEPRLVVQYKESDLAFVSRLAEHVGISIFFEHVDGVDKVVFTDQPSGFGAPATLSYRTGGGERGITSLKRRFRAVPTVFFAQDYNYRAPDQQLVDEASGAVVFDTLGARKELEAQLPGAVVEFAPNAKSAREAGLLARVHAERVEAERDRYVFLADHGVLAPGHRFQVEDHPRVAEELELLCVETRWVYASPDAFGATEKKLATFSVAGSAVIAAKSGAIEGILATYRPPRVTPRPRIHGILTGVIQPYPGTSGLLQNLDGEGRYLVRFHFDQRATSTPRVRMAQPHAGPDYGMHFPLRPGVEVAITFLDGDPDRPVILGALPNNLTSSPVFVPRPDAGDELLARMVEIHRIKTKSGVIIEIGDSITSSDTSLP